MQYFIDSPHKIDNTAKLTFQEKEYSLFKFGASDIGRRYAAQLLPLIESFLANSQKKWKSIVVYSSPYDFIPTATHTMALPFYQALKKNPLTQNIEVIWNKIKRTTTYTVDYGNLSAEERFNLIGGDVFELETIPQPDALLVFIDDIKITGSHERVIRQMLDNYRLSNACLFYYFAILRNGEIPPAFENQLNYAHVNSPERVVELLHRRDFSFNTRMVKYILANPEKAFRFILANMKDEQMRDLIRLSVGNGYQKLGLYAPNFKRLLQMVETIAAIRSPYPATKKHTLDRS